MSQYAAYEQHIMGTPYAQLDELPVMTRNAQAWARRTGRAVDQAGVVAAEDLVVAGVPYAAGASLAGLEPAVIRRLLRKGLAVGGGGGDPVPDPARTVYTSSPPTTMNPSLVDGPIRLGVEFKVTDSDCTFDGARAFFQPVASTDAFTAALYEGTTQVVAPFTSLLSLAVASASSQFNYEYPPVQAFDGNAATRWVTSAAPSLGSPQWVKIVLPEAKVLTSYTILPIPTLGGGNDPKDWTFEGSSDGTSWAPLDTRAGYVFPARTAQTFSFSNSTAYTQYRWHFTATDGSNILAIVDFSIFDAEGEVLTRQHRWIEVDLGTPYALTPETRYTAVLSFPSIRPRNYATASFPNNDLVSGPLTVYSADNTSPERPDNHSYAYGAGVELTTESVQTNYQIDVMVSKPTPA